MAVPYRREKEVRLREMFSSEYKLITLLPSWSVFTYHEAIDDYIDDIVFARYKDILIDPERYMSTLDAWLQSHLIDFERAYEALVKEYDPLSNYDMIEREGEISKEGERVSAAKRYGTERTTTTIPETKSSRYTTTYDSAAEGRLDAYTTDTITNAPTLDGHKAQVTQTEQIPDSSQRQGAEVTESYKGGVEISAPETELTGDRGSQRELTRSGNIGVTTSQQMLQSEIDLRVKYSFANFFCDLFAREMTIGVWEL
jgi:hypothetical protein